MSSHLLPRLILGFAAVVALILALIVGVVLEVPVGGAILVGMAVLAGIGSWWVGRRGAQADALTAAFEARQRAAPDAPWTWREDWSQTRHTGSVNRLNPVLAIVAIALLAAYGVIVAYEILVLEAGWDMQLLAPLLGAVLLYKPAKRMLLKGKAGPTTVVLEDVPVHLGERIEGVARTGLEVVPTSGVEVRLVCVQRKVTQRRDAGVDGGTSRFVSETVRWEATETVQAHSERAEAPSSRPQQVVVPFAFDLPAGDASGIEPTSMIPAWREANAASRILWRIEVSADANGTDFESSVEVPVFQSAPVLEGDPATHRLAAG